MGHIKQLLKLKKAVSHQSADYCHIASDDFTVAAKVMMKYQYQHATEAPTVYGTGIELLRIVCGLLSVRQKL